MENKRSHFFTVELYDTILLGKINGVKVQMFRREESGSRLEGLPQVHLFQVHTNESFCKP